MFDIYEQTLYAVVKNNPRNIIKNHQNFDKKVFYTCSVKSRLSRAVRGLANSLVGFRCLITRSCRKKRNNTLAGTRRSHSGMQAKMKIRICLRFQNRPTTIAHAFPGNIVTISDTFYLRRVPQILKLHGCHWTRINFTVRVTRFFYVLTNLAGTRPMNNRMTAILYTNKKGEWNFLWSRENIKFLRLIKY